MSKHEQRWRKLAEGAEEKLQFQNAFAAADGEHISLYSSRNTALQLYRFL